MSWQKWLRFGPINAPTLSTSITVTSTRGYSTREASNGPQAASTRPQVWVKMSPGPWRKTSTSRELLTTCGIVTSTNYSLDASMTFRYAFHFRDFFIFQLHDFSQFVETEFWSSLKWIKWSKIWMRFLKRHYYLLQMTVHSGHTSVISTPKFKLGSLNCKISFAFSLKIAGLKNKLFDHCTVVPAL